MDAATLHPAKLLNITDHKGTLEHNTDADFIMLDEELDVIATYIAGDLVWHRDWKATDDVAEGQSSKKDKGQGRQKEEKRDNDEGSEKRKLEDNQRKRGRESVDGRKRVRGNRKR